MARSHADRECMIDQIEAKHERERLERLRKELDSAYWGYPMGSLRFYGMYQAADASKLSNQVRLTEKSDDWVELDESELGLMNRWLDIGFAKHPSNADLGYAIKQVTAGEHIQ